jgi:hypothetical protein
MFKLRSLFDKSPFILSVVGEHLCSEWSFAGAPRRNVGILFGHRCYATTKQYNAVHMIGAVSRHTRKVRLSPHEEESFKFLNMNALSVRRDGRCETLPWARHF